MASTTAYTEESIDALATAIDADGSLNQANCQIAICRKGAMFHAIVFRP